MTLDDLPGRYAVVRTSVDTALHGPEYGVDVSVGVPIVNKTFKECAEFAERHNRIASESRDSERYAVVRVPDRMSDDDEAVKWICASSRDDVVRSMLGLVGIPGGDGSSVRLDGGADA